MEKKHQISSNSTPPQHLQSLQLKQQPQPRPRLDVGVLCWVECFMLERGGPSRSFSWKSPYDDTRVSKDGPDGLGGGCTKRLSMQGQSSVLTY